MKNIIFTLLFIACVYGEDKIGVQFIGDEKLAKSRLEMQIFNESAKEDKLNYRWISSDDVDTKDCKYLVNYIANYDTETKHLNVTMTFFIGEALDSFEVALSVKTDNPLSVGKKMVSNLMKIGLSNIDLPNTVLRR